MHDLYNGLTMSKTKKIKKYVIGAKHSTVTFKEKKKNERKTSSLVGTCQLLTGHQYII